MGIGALGLTNKELADSLLRTKNVRSTFFISIGTASSGNIGGALQPEEAFILDGGGFFEGEIALVSHLTSGFPDYEPVYDSGGAMVTVTSLNAAGDYTLSAVPTGAVSFAFIYAYTVPLAAWDPNRSLTESQIEQNLQSVYGNSVVPILTLASTPGAFNIRDNAAPLGVPLFTVQDSGASITYFSVSADGTIVTNAFTVGDIKYIDDESQLPAIVSGKILLEADILYVPSRSFTLTADTLVFPSGSTGWTQFNSIPSPVTHTGAGPLFEARAGALVLINNAFFIGDGTQTVYDVDGATGFFTSEAGLTNFGAMGTIKNTAQATFLSNQFTNVGTGITLEDISDIVVLAHVEIKNAVTSNTANWSFAGTFDRITSSSVTGNPQIGESIFDIDPGITINAGSFLDTTFSDLNGGSFFAAGSLDQTDIRFDFEGGSGAPESQQIGEMTSFSNAVETAISTADTYVPINFVTGGTVTLQAFKANPGATGAITAFADPGGGLVTVTSVSHSLATGDTVSISGTTNYNDVYVVTVLTGSTYNITETFNGDDATGTWYRPPNIEYEGRSNNNIMRTEGEVLIDNDPSIEGDSLTTAVFMDSGLGYVIISSTERRLNMGEALGSPQKQFNSNGFTGLSTGTLFTLFGKNGTIASDFVGETVKLSVYKL